MGQHDDFPAIQSLQKTNINICRNCTSYGPIVSKTNNFNLSFLLIPDNIEQRTLYVVRTCWIELDCWVVWKVENGQFKAEKWSGHLIQTDTWLDLKLLGVFFFHDQLQHCCGSVKRVKKEDKATAGYRLSNSQRSPGRHLKSQTIFTPDYGVSNQPITHTTIHFLWPTQTNTWLSCSLRATRRAAAFFLLNAVNNLSHANKMFTRKTSAHNK